MVNVVNNITSEQQHHSSGYHVHISIQFKTELAVKFLCMNTYGHICNNQSMITFFYLC